MRKGQKLKRRRLKSDPQALRGQEKMRKGVSAVRVQDMDGRLVRHWSREDLIEISHRVVRDQARDEMTMNAQDVKDISSGGLVS